MIHVLVADTCTVRMPEGATSNTLAEVVAYRNPAFVRHERDLVSDRPGRVINAAARIHQAYEPTARRVRKRLQPALRAATRKTLRAEPVYRGQRQL